VTPPSRPGVPLEVGHGHLSCPSQLVPVQPGNTTTQAQRRLGSQGELAGIGIPVGVDGDQLDIVINDKLPAREHLGPVLAMGFRIGGAILMVFSIFMGIAFGLAGWILVFASGEYAALNALVVGRWSSFYRIAARENDAMEGKQVGPVNEGTVRSP